MRVRVLVLVCVCVCVWRGGALGGGGHVCVYACERVYVCSVVDRFYIALFSALEQTHCAHVACDSE